MERQEVRLILVLTALLALGLLLMGASIILNMSETTKYILAIIGFLVALASFGYVIYSALTR